MLIIRALAPIFLIGLSLWAISTPYLEMSEYGPLILIGFIAWAVYAVYQFYQWFDFKIAISEQGLKVKKVDYAWSDFKTATAKTAFQFQTFIELVTHEDKKIKIPAAIDQHSFVLTAIEKYLPQLIKNS